MKRTLIPRGNADRVAAVLAILTTPLVVYASITYGYPDALILALCVVALLIMAYGYPQQIEDSASANEYSAVIERISTIGKELSDLNRFLEGERTRVADIEATVRKLSDEKSKLEPVVSTQRETVEAILAAHSERTARQAWKERLLGFALGVIASLIASFVYGYFHR
jgi:septal ring factor EnvC (AmiA/AmiB activator)